VVLRRFGQLCHLAHKSPGLFKIIEVELLEQPVFGFLPHALYLNTWPQGIA
jgi:hypothetical protein